MQANSIKCWPALLPVAEALASTLEEKAVQPLAFLRGEATEKPVIRVGAGTCGLGAGADKTLKVLREHLANRDVQIMEVGCIGLCHEEPLLDIQLPGRPRVFFSQVTADKASALVDNALAGNIDKELLLGQFPQEGLEPWADVNTLESLPFFAKQTRLALRNCGLLDPSNLAEYVARGGYGGLVKALQMTPEAVCQEVEKSGLRGRGGGGFPTGRKWQFARQEKSDQKYLICNADEGDPGAFMDRALIESDPFRLLEGMTIAAYAIGASKAYIYIRAEYPLAVARLEEALIQAKDWGLLGQSVLGKFSFEIKIKMGAGAFVCGEETALIASIEGQRGSPRPRPPFPAIKGAFGKPSNVNNVETFANVPEIILDGAQKFASYGTEHSKGTKIFALSGKVRLTGLVEVAMGSTIGNVVFDIGGGVSLDKTCKAVQIGGPSGGCVPVSHFDTLIDYENLKEVGAMMGSGGLVVMDEDTCMVDLARFFMEFLQSESCGKCVPCREGTKRMFETLDMLTRPRGSEQSIEDTLIRFQAMTKLEGLAKVVSESALCGLGMTASNPVLSTIRWFRSEYEQHIFERRCPAGACSGLAIFTICEDKCTGCGLCSRRCPVGAVSGQAKQLHVINHDKCIACGICQSSCKFSAVNKAA